MAFRWRGWLSLWVSLASRLMNCCVNAVLSALKWRFG